MILALLTLAREAADGRALVGRAEAVTPAHLAKDDLHKLFRAEPDGDGVMVSIRADDDRWVSGRLSTYQYYLSNLPPDTGLKRLAAAIKERHKRVGSAPRSLGPDPCT